MRPVTIHAGFFRTHSLVLLTGIFVASGWMGMAAPSAACVLDDTSWSTDAEASVKLANEEDRDLLLLFTGSDWCPPCIQLEKNILGKAAFLDKTRDNFVLVMFDFPQTRELPEDIERQNQEWSDRYGIEGFPTVVLVDKDLKPYAFTGFRDESPTDYVAHLDELQKARITRDKFLDQAASATGLDRARLLDEALTAIDPTVVEVYYGDIVEEIGELDRDDEAGLRTKYFAARDREIRKAVMSNISMVSRLRKPEEAIQFIDETLSQHKLPVAMWLTAQSTKLRLLRGLDRIDEANQLIGDMIDVNGIDTDTRQRLIVNKAYYLVSLSQADQAFSELDRFIASSPENLLLTIARGELHDSLGQFELAIQSYDKAIIAAAAIPEILVEVVGAKADAQFELKQVEQAIATLDGIVDSNAIPGKLRAEVLLHKALFLRESGRRRAAILSENKAVEIVDTVEDKAEIQKLVDQFRRKFDKDE